MRKPTQASLRVRHQAVPPEKCRRASPLSTTALSTTVLQRSLSAGPFPSFAMREEAGPDLGDEAGTAGANPEEEKRGNKEQQRQRDEP